MITDTPVALCCFLNRKLWLILEEIGGQGSDPLVLYKSQFEKVSQDVCVYYHNNILV